MSDEPRQPDTKKKAPLDGEWFRRERLRVAIGRRVIALRLDVPESRVQSLELKNREVPASWLPVLATLEFRVPIEIAPSPRAPGPPSAAPSRRGAEPSPPSHHSDAQTFVHPYEDDLGGFWLRVQRELRHILQKNLIRRLTSFERKSHERARASALPWSVVVLRDTRTGPERTLGMSPPSPETSFRSQFMFADPGNVPSLRTKAARGLRRGREPKWVLWFEEHQTSSF